MGKGIVNFKGTMRNYSHDNVPDGACEQIINMRYEKNAWVPVGPKSLITFPTIPANLVGGISSTKKMWGCNLDTGMVLVIFDSSTGVIQIMKNYQDTGWAGPFALATFLGKTINIKFLNNVILIFDNTDKQIHYAISSPDPTIIYYYAGTMQLPEIDFNPINYTLVGPGSIVINYTSVDQLDWNTAFSAALYADQNVKYQAGFIEGSVSIICAYELFDGTYIYHSVPKRLFVGNSSGIFDNSPGYPYAPLNPKMLLWSNGAPNTLGLQGYAYGQILMEFNIGANLALLKSNYKDIIKNITVFMTKPQPSILLDDAWQIGASPGSERVLKHSPYYDINTGPTTSGSMIYQDINYYRVAIYSLDDTRLALGSNPLPVGDLTDIATRLELPVDNFSRVQLHSTVSQLYNSRLNLANINVNFPSILNFWISTAGNPTTNIYWCEFTINTDQGIFVVNSATVNSTNSDGSVDVLSFPFPDSRCSKMRIVKQAGVSGPMYATGYFNMAPNNIHNFSYFYDPAQQSTFNIPDSAFATATLGTKMSYTEPTRVQISQVNNPFYFPANLSYHVGASDILGLADNAMPVDLTQFGQYPIIVFSKDGNWAMNIGTGNVYITNITPHSSKPAVSGTILARVEDFIIYQSIEGLMIMGGRDSNCATKILETGFGNPLINDTIYQSILGSLQLVGLYSSVTNDDFLNNFIAIPSNLILGYNFKKREIIISNLGNQNYSWVYSLISNSWQKISDTFSSFINCFGLWYGIRSGDGKIVDLAVETQNAPVQVMIQTAPVNFGDQMFKNLKRSLLRCRVTLNNGCFFGFYLYRRQIDSWLLVGGNETAGIANIVNNSPIPKGSTSQEYIFIFIGQLTQGFITGIESEIEQAYTSKIR
jgi:hypothetical protein